jgi:hypothetical protein
MAVLCGHERRENRHWTPAAELPMIDPSATTQHTGRMKIIDIREVT